MARRSRGQSSGANRELTAERHDIALQFANFLDMLSAPVNVPGVTV